MFRLPPLPTTLHVVPSSHAVQRSFGDATLCLTVPALLTAFDLPEPDARPRLNRFVTRWLVEQAATQASVPSTGAAAGGDPAAPSGAPRGPQVELMVEALRRLRELAVGPQVLSRACRAAGVDDEVARALAAYSEQLRQLGAEDATAGRRAALAGASRTEWPGMLQQVQRVVVGEGVELVGLSYALIEAMAQSGRVVTVQLPSTGPNSAEMAYTDAMQTSLEASEAPGLEIELTDHAKFEAAAWPREAVAVDEPKFSGADAIRPAAGDVATEDAGTAPGSEGVRTVSTVRLPAGDAGMDRLAWEIRRLVQAGVAPQAIGVVLPGSVRPHWWRAQGVQQLLEALHEMGVVCSARQNPRVNEVPLGRLLIDAVSLACELQATGGAQASVGAWGRLAGGCWHFGSEGDAAAAGGEPSGSLLEAPATFDEAERPRPGLRSAVAEPMLDGGPLADAPEPAVPPMPAMPWLGRHVDERVAVGGLAAWLQANKGTLADDARSAAVRAQAILHDLTAPLLAAPDMPSLLASLIGVFDALAAAVPPTAQGDAIRKLFVDWQQGWNGYRALLGPAASPAPVGPSDGALPFLLRSIQRERLAPDASQQGVALLRPEEVTPGVWRYLFVVGADDAVFFAPRRPNVYLPDALGRAIRRLGGPFVGPAAGILQDRPPNARDRPLWLWQRAIRSATEHTVACWLLPATEQDAGVHDLFALKPASAGACEPQQLQPVTMLPVPQQPSLFWQRRAAAAQGDCHQAPSATPEQAYLQARWQPRASTSTPTLSAPLAAQLAAQWRRREHAASALDELGRCRYRYAARHLLGLNAHVRPDVVAARPILGSAIHAALRDALADLAASPLQLPTSPQGKAAWLAEAEQRFWQREKTYLPAGSVHGHLRASTLATMWSAVAVQLEQWLDEGDVRAVLVEQAFGGSAPWRALQLPWPEGGNDVAVRGAIDRIDVAKSEVRVSDYKSSTLRRVAGRHLQLPAYALVALRELGPSLRVQAAWRTLLGGEAGKVVPASLPTAYDDLLALYAEDVFVRAAPLLEGEWTVDPENDKTCDFCAYGMLCHRPQLRGDDAAEGEEEA